ncbi:MFS transporter [Rhodococcus chondri]|uniref:MFS transporter n=1 Tax=Rhodococcus chondri TaxID=3065941 RepID=A0ABU7JKN0_9NOCA|nr:MFS transporter [Rhodococcus sp. CC-R104]MEE2030598.1 MFS transporter [Rhodococcus sp. CC-R104]
MAVVVTEKSRTVRPEWVMASIFLVFTVSNAPAPLYVLWQREMGFSQTTVALIFVSYIAGAIVSLLVGGRSADRFGRRAVLIPALALAVAACALFAAARNPIWLESGRFLIGVASGAFGAAGGAAIADLCGVAGRARAALYASVAPVAGSAVGPLLSGALADFAPAPTSLVFVVLIIPLVLAALPISRTGGRPAVPATGRLLQFPRFPPGTGAIVLLAMAVAGSPFALAGLFISLGPAMISELIGNDTRLLAGAVSFMVFGAGAGSQVLARRMSTYRVAATGLGISVLAAALIAVAVGAESVPVIIAAALTAGLGQSLAQLAGLQLVRACAPEGRGAEVTALVWLAGYGTVGSGILTMGLLADEFGLLAASYAFCSLFFLCVCAALVQLVRRREVVDRLCSPESLTPANQ